MRRKSAEINDQKFFARYSSLMTEIKPPRKPDQEELWLSVSKTKSFLECKARYNYSYNLKLPQKDNTFTIFGKFNHVALEHFHLAYLNGSENPFNIEMTNAFKIAAQEFKTTISKEDKAECRRILGQYLEIVSATDNLMKFPPEEGFDQTAIGHRSEFPVAKIVGCEQKFKVPIQDGKIILNGMIDRVQIDGDNVVHVADYKTIKNKAYLHKNDLQLLTYAWVIFQDHPEIEKVRCSYVLLRHNFEWVSKEFSRDDVKGVEEEYSGYRENILTEKEFPPTTSALCSYCPYLDKCEPGQKKARVYSGEVSW